MNQEHAVSLARQHASSQGHNLGELLWASAPIGESDLQKMEATCAVALPDAMRQQKLTQWEAVFFLHERYRPQARRTLLTHGQRCHQAVDDVVKEGDGATFSEWNLLEMCELESYLVDAITGAVAPHHRPMPLWRRRLWRMEILLKSLIPWRKPMRDSNSRPN
jgi:hypothetical protein